MSTLSEAGHSSGRGERTTELVRLSKSSPLAPGLAAAWSRELSLQAQRGECSGPFLGPEVANALGRSCDDVAVLVGYDDGQPKRFLAMHVAASGRARALGGRFCDQSGPTGSMTSELLESMLKQVALKSWRYGRNPLVHGLASQHIWSRSVSHIVEIGEGLDDLRRRRRADGSRFVDQLLRKERKLEREVGPLRFEFAHGEQAALDKLLEWKSAQRQQTGSVDVFRQGWARAALENLHASGNGGKLNVLWAGDQLVAMHFGLADQRTLHWWIPTYDRRWATFSPGLILMLHLIRACRERGIQEIDLGHGDERYKASLATLTRGLYSGAVDESGVRCAVGRGKAWVREAVRQSSLETGWIATKRIARRSSFFRQP
ncbi:MAG: GNAT family N-acetyltransferase [bacterium]|nr:GNAT family N-acetyltransferase [bacterium]